MKKLVFLFPLMIFTFINANSQRVHRLFDASWKFYRGDVINGENENLNDQNWRTIDLPHDWSIEDLPNQSDSVIGPFSAKSVGATATGYTVGGTSWYRKHFIENNTANKKVVIYFDGVYMNSDVYINGHHLGNHPYGYTPFSYDITPYLKNNNQENVVAVRVSNEGKNSRWYSGSGIYRHVWLTVTPKLHLGQWGVYITTPGVSDKAATVSIKSDLVNEENIDKKVILHTTIFDGSNKKIAERKNEMVVSGTNSSSTATVNKAEQAFQISAPHLWSPGAPYLYHAVSELVVNNKVIDRVTNNFGIRSIDISADKGFLLNGKRILLRGGCVHHDNGPLGSTTIDAAEIRKVRLLKSFGFNAVRTSHNPPSQQFLDACDSIGLIVIDEAFDQWERPKNPQDYHLYFDTSWQKDIAAMVQRDRNHPAVVFWSIGNEINERADSSGLGIAKKLRDEVKSFDHTRPVTEAICHFWDHPGYKWDTTAAAFKLLDVGGYNYLWKMYESDHNKYPERVMMGTESFPLEAFENWQQVKEHPYVIGDFVWTAMDYLGETGIGHTSSDSTQGFQLQTFPWFNSWCGDIDLIGGKKPQSYYRDVVWGISKMEMLVHKPVPAGHTEAVSAWGWPGELHSFTFPGDEGKKMQVHVYTSYSTVRLLLNGKTIGEQNVSEATKLTATFNISYEPGVLEAIAFQDGVAVDSLTLQTAGKPAKVRLTADRNHIHADQNDLSYVTAEIVDDKGHIVPNAVMPLHFRIEGAGKIIATANANPSDMESFQQPQHKTFEGKCLVIVQPKGKAGIIKLKAEGEGLESGELIISSK
ncbi:MAG TPA: glycoside hydrolase family 2 TIM barrel-domain containing protein [Hanamia sp.]|nr:glycoside hydrolase family 2 TIM barrel-domain containing protein [Hanamia sp.]